MSELEDKLTAVLNNPQMMQQIMTLAQSMGQPSAEPKQAPQTAQSPAIPNPELIQKLSGMIRQNQVDAHQQALLQALNPYLSRSRVEKLERAMRAAHMAELASSLLSSGALQGLFGR